MLEKEVMKVIMETEARQLEHRFNVQSFLFMFEVFEYMDWRVFKTEMSTFYIARGDGTLPDLRQAKELSGLLDDLRLFSPMAVDGWRRHGKDLDDYGALLEAYDRFYDDDEPGE